MESPHRSPPEMSLNSRFIRLRQFFQDVYDLPWVATRILAHYIHGGTVERSIDAGHVQHGILTNNLPSISLLVYLHVVQILFTITIAIRVRTTFPTLAHPSLTSMDTQAHEADHLHSTNIGVDTLFIRTVILQSTLHNLSCIHHSGLSLRLGLGYTPALECGRPGTWTAGDEVGETDVFGCAITSPSIHSSKVHAPPGTYYRYPISRPSAVYPGYI